MKNTGIIQSNFLLRFLLNSKYRIYRHLLLLLLFAVFFLSHVEHKDAAPLGQTARIIVFVVAAALLYFNMYFLVPRFLFRNKYALYFLFILIIALATYFMANVLSFYFSHVALHKGFLIKRSGNLGWFIFIFCVFMAASTAVRLFQRLVADNQRITELENITAQSELEQLKNQINPHFLFNMLNNANVLIHKDPEKASQVLMKLSDLLRYQLYDSKRNSVLLTADIHFLTDFLNLEKIRRNNFEFIISKEGELNGVMVPPLLFISFVENAVKHNVDADNKSYVHLFFSVQNNVLYFTCINSKAALPTVKNKRAGLGMANVKRRLELLYPSDRHTLNIKNNIDTFDVNLALKL